MIHCCVECVKEEEVAVESYECKACRETYCAHFMKEIGPAALCWVCGSEKRKETNEVPLPPLR